MTAQSSTRDLLAAKRAEAKSNTSGPTRTQPPRQASSSSRGGWGGVNASGANDTIEERSIDTQIRKAARSGKLDISNLELESFPAEVYIDLIGIPADQLSKPPPPQPAGQRPRNGVSDPEELTVLKASENQIRELDIEIGMFGGLLSLDLRGNRLSSLPNSFADLLRLTTLDLSHNEFTDLPSALQYLPKLDLLNLSHNRISTIDLTKPIEASPEGQAYGAGFLSTSFSRQSKKDNLPILFKSLRSFNLSHNQLTNQSLEGMVHDDVWPSMRFLNLEHNRLDGILNLRRVGIEWGTMKIEKLNLSYNAHLRDITRGHLPGPTIIEMVGCNTGGLGQDINPHDTAPGNDGTAAPPPRPDGPTLPIPSPDLTIVYRTTPAATFNSEPLKIDFDLYLPSQSSSEKGHALVIWFHGGGLLQGNKENLPPHFRRLPSHPFASTSSPDEPQHVAVISPNYRLSPQAPIMDILSDLSSLLIYIRTKLNDQLVKEGKGEHKIDGSRICLSGGSAGGYLAMMGGVKMPRRADIEDIGGYLGEDNIKCIAPFYPISDLIHPFWSTKFDPAPWMSRSVTDEEAKPHLNTRLPPICTAVSGGPRSILYPYMLQNALFPGLIFMAQKNIGSGNLAFRPTVESLSIPRRLEILKQFNTSRPPVYFVYGTIDRQVQPMETTLDALRNSEGAVEVQRMEGADHQFDEDPNVECEDFREWLGRNLL